MRYELLFTLESREATSKPIQAAKQMTLETNERRRRRLSFVRAGTHGIQPPSRSPAYHGGGNRKISSPDFCLG